MALEPDWPFQQRAVNCAGGGQHCAVHARPESAQRGRTTMAGVNNERNSVSGSLDASARAGEALLLEG